MKEKYLCIDPDGSLEWIELDAKPGSDYEGCRLDLDQIYNALGCSCIEKVRTIIRDVVLLVDDCGKICDPPKPVNVLASRFYAGSAFGDMIHGRAMLLHDGICNSIGEHDLFPLDPSELPLVQYFLLDCYFPHCDFRR